MLQKEELLALIMNFHSQLIILII